MKKIFTQDNPLTQPHNTRQQSAFTMAEILLSLTIIGVVAAITLPSLTGNINERTWNTQRKALHARMSQAISLMPSLNGFGIGNNQTQDEILNNSAETFLSGGLSKVLKINNICDNEHLTDCGLPEKITPMSGGSIIDFPKSFFDLSGLYTDAGLDFRTLNTKAAAMETQNGESLAVYYAPNCTPENMDGGYIDDYSGTMEMVDWDRAVCANFIYDLNGTKGPNTVGKDIGFITVFYPTDSQIVAPMPNNQDASSSDVNLDTARALCNSQNDTRLPNILELDSMALNWKLLDSEYNSGVRYHSGTVGMSPMTNKMSTVSMALDAPTNYYLYKTSSNNSSNGRVRCVKR